MKPNETKTNKLPRIPGYPIWAFQVNVLQNALFVDYIHCYYFCAWKVSEFFTFLLQLSIKFITLNKFSSQ